MKHSEIFIVTLIEICTVFKRGFKFKIVITYISILLFIIILIMQTFKNACKTLPDSELNIAMYFYICNPFFK